MHLRQLCSCLWPPRRSFFSFLMLFDEFSALYLLFVTFILYFQDGSAASVQVDMQIEAAARLKSTLSDLPALEISRNISCGAPQPIFQNESRGPTSNRRRSTFLNFLHIHCHQLRLCHWPPCRSLSSFSTHSEHFNCISVRSYYTLRRVLQPVSKWTSRSKPFSRVLPYTRLA